MYGTTGTLVVERHDAKMLVRLERGGGRTTLYEPDPLPEGRNEVAFELIHHLDTGDPLHPVLCPNLNIDTMAILDAGVRSAQSNALALVDNAASFYRAQGMREIGRESYEPQIFGDRGVVLLAKPVADRTP